MSNPEEASVGAVAAQVIEGAQRIQDGIRALHRATEDTSQAAGILTGVLDGTQDAGAQAGLEHVRAGGRELEAARESAQVALDGVKTYLESIGYAGGIPE